MTNKKINYLGIDVYYESNLNGGGMDFGQDYITVIQNRYAGKCFEHTYEFCAGPGFIGFSILAHGLTKKLCLSDKFTPAYESMCRTVKENSLEHKVNCFNVEGVKDVAASGFDLVVSNPPHFLNKCEWLTHIDDRIYIDENWNVHREFYKNISTKMTDDGIILIQENALGSEPEMFEPMIKEARLKISDVFSMKEIKGNDKIYYLEVVKA